MKNVRFCLILVLICFSRWAGNTNFVLLSYLIETWTNVFVFPIFFSLLFCNLTHQFFQSNNPDTCQHRWPSSCSTSDRGLTLAGAWTSCTARSTCRGRGSRTRPKRTPRPAESFRCIDHSQSKGQTLNDFVKD